MSRGRSLSCRTATWASLRRSRRSSSGRDTARAAPGPAAHAGADAPLQQRDRVDDRNLPRTGQERQVVASRADSAALVRRRDPQGEHPVFPLQRSPPPPRSGSSAGTASPWRGGHAPRRLRGQFGLNPQIPQLADHGDPSTSPEGGRVSTAAIVPLTETGPAARSLGYRNWVRVDLPSLTIRC